MVKLSIVISAYNEEKKIKACLDSAKWADEIIFVDNSSTDKTAEIAKKYTQKVFVQKNDPANIDLQKNFGIEKATGDWILVLDSDEVISLELAREIREVTKHVSDEVSGFWIPRKNFIFDKWIEHSGWYPDYQLRLIRRGKGKYEKQHYHEPIAVEGSTEKLSENLIHYHYDTIMQFLLKSLHVYAPNEAEELLRKGYVFTYSDAIHFPLKEFLSRYFAREGYKDGFHGLMLALLMAAYHFGIFAYLWEKKKFVDDRQATLRDLESEVKQANREVMYWFARQKIEEEKDSLKKFGLQVKRKLKL